MLLRRWLRGGVAVGIGVVVITALSGCGKHAEAGATVAPAAVADVSLIQPEWQTFETSVEQPGWIRAFESSPLYTKINGYVQKMNVEIGTRIRKGDVLAVLWVPETDEELIRKRALVDQAKIEITQAARALDVARANLETAKSLVTESKAALKFAQAHQERWRSEYARVDQLVSKQVIDKQVRDETLNQFKSAEAGVELAQAKIQSAQANQIESAAKCEKAQADLAASNNRLLVSEADYRGQKAILDYAKVVAPFDGVVVDRLVDTGRLMQPGGFGNAKNDDPLLIVCRTDIVRVFLDVPENDAVLVRDGAEATVRVQSLKEKEFTGKVAGTSWALDVKQRTLRVEIDFQNPTGELRPGMYAYAKIRANDTKVRTLPASAIESRDGTHYCFFVEDGKAVRGQVKIGVRQGTLVEVLQKQTKSADGRAATWQHFSGEERVPVRYPSHWMDGQAIQP